ncbi:MAG: hypothetical protein ACOC5B_02560 [Myxococcota bacterium]
MTDVFSGATGRLPFRLLWGALLLLPLIELTGHAVIRARVPDRADWKAAAAHVRELARPDDAFAVAPPWADPLLRRELGDRIALAEAGRSDLAPFTRLWALTIRGHRPAEAPSRPPDQVEHFGRVRVLRWDLGPSPVRFDLVEQVPQAEVSRARAEGEQSCPWRRLASRGGGLGAGPAVPAERFVCDSARGHLWVAPTIIEDLSLEPRHCVWQHPQGRQPVRVRYRDVPLGDRIVLYAGLYYEHERRLEGGPVDVVIRVDDRVVGRMVHRDGDGWKRMEASTRGLGARGTVTVEVSAPAPHLRSLCWAATVREGER